MAKQIVFTFLLFIFFKTSIAASITYNVVSLGAKPDGKSDTSKVFLSVWAKACVLNQPVTIYVPKGSFYLKTITFSGQTCKNTRITFRIDGTLIAPSSYSSGTSTNWIKFIRVTGVTVIGGTLDGKGSSLWSCKTSGKCSDSTGATSISFYNSNNIAVSGLTSINSQMFHLLIYGCQNAKLQSIKVMAPGNSPNTDGIHVQLSTGVTILNSRIATGDDCISMGPGNSNLWIENIACGPGHGISIGSLGWVMGEPGVQNVTVKTVTFTGTQNGVRIKTLPRSDSSGFVKSILFQHLVMKNVQNPILIDQEYCPNGNCPKQASGVQVSDITYQDIHGSSATPVAVNFDCSKKFGCSKIRLVDVNLMYMNKPARASCSNAGGSASGVVQPSSCL